MDQGIALELCRQGIHIAIMVLTPILGVGLSVGLGVSIFQAVTSVQETTLTFVPKLLAIASILTLSGSWIVTQLIAFTHICFQRISTVGRL